MCIILIIWVKWLDFYIQFTRTVGILLIKKKVSVTLNCFYNDQSTTIYCSIFLLSQKNCPKGERIPYYKKFYRDTTKYQLVYENFDDIVMGKRISLVESISDLPDKSLNSC